MERAPDASRHCMTQTASQADAVGAHFTQTVWYWRGSLTEVK